MFDLANACTLSCTTCTRTYADTLRTTPCRGIPWKAKPSEDDRSRLLCCTRPGLRAFIRRVCKQGLHLPAHSYWHPAAIGEAREANQDRVCGHWHRGTLPVWHRRVPAQLLLIVRREQVSQNRILGVPLILGRSTKRDPLTVWMALPREHNQVLCGHRSPHSEKW